MFYIPWKELAMHKEQQHLSNEEILSTPFPELGVELLWPRHGTTLRKGFLMDKSCFLCIPSLGAESVRASVFVRSQKLLNCHSEKFSHFPQPPFSGMPGGQQFSLPK